MSRVHQVLVNDHGFIYELEDGVGVTVTFFQSVENCVQSNILTLIKINN